MNPERRARGKKELQIHGPRPAPLKISKDSHKIRKPAVPQLPNRSQPVIIYTESPKIIHIEAHEFMTLVQRLTGSSSSEGPDVSDDKREDLEEKIAEESSSADNGSRSSANFDIYEKHEDSANLENKADYKTLKLQPPPAFSPLSPNFFLPSPHLLSPNIFQDLPLFTPNFDSFFYSPGHFYRLSEPFTPQRTPPASIISPPATANTHPQC